MRRQGNLFDKIVETDNLHFAAKKALRGKRFKRTAGGFYFGLENEILRMGMELENESYIPMANKTFKIFEPKERLVSCAEFYDRVVHHAIINILEPIFERRMIHDTYACRKGRGTLAALEKSKRLVVRYAYCLKCDIRKYFESVDHGVLKRLMGELFRDKKLLRLLDKIIFHGSGDKSSRKGLPIGNLTSQHFANVYMGELDSFVKRQLGCKGYLRYMDDFMLFSDSKRELGIYLEKIKWFLSDVLKLRLKEKVVGIFPTGEGVPFLGFRVFPRLVRLQRNNLLRFRRKIARMEGGMRPEDRDNSVRSVIAHVSQGNTMNMRRKFFHGPEVVNRRQPRYSRRWLEQQCSQPAFGKSQQRQCRQQEQRHRVPFREYKDSPDKRSSRTSLLRTRLCPDLLPRAGLKPDE